eukprot:CAMPEP_0119318454 /NCGR_PEP_ID=MMETSP1333-20130426/46489_1 /TAXON_ID=418940 /ORGANISM="Scyphosphaera apsteinii, Strain RCC1455" /LENGTH=446 /DNA_ID=CAMNT_0007324631 /DNA_START=83 /DNA_END=1423 /DNA_ORIENTATION=+
MSGKLNESIAEEMHRYLLENHVEDNVENAVNKTLRARAPKSSLHMASTLLASAGLPTLSSAIEELSMNRNQPEDSMAWLVSRLGPVPAYRPTVQDLLDIFNIVGHFTVIQAYLDARGAFEKRVSVVAAATINKPIADVSDEVLKNVADNLRAAEPVTPHVERAMRLVLEHSPSWKFEDSGRVDKYPTMRSDEIRAMQFTQEEVTTIRHIIFAHAPPVMTDYMRVRRVREACFHQTLSAQNPVAIVTVGAPGGGKTYVATQACVPYLQQHHGTPQLNALVHIDPDKMISGVCDNNNAYRPLANFCNHETFLAAVGQRRHMLFDGTGKDLMNTCGRVISRLRAANYRVFICIVLASYDKCLQRIRTRFEETGRDVPEPFVRMTNEALQKVIPVYLHEQQSMCEALLIYDNDSDVVDVSPRVISNGASVTEALSFCQNMLQIPDSASKG